MGCFSWGLIENLFIFLVIICGAIAIVKLLLPRILGNLGDMGSLVFRVLSILLWMAVAIFLIYIAIEVFSCLAASSGSGLRLR